MKKLIMGMTLLSTVSAFANDFGPKLKSCDFGFATISYELVDLSNVPMDKGLYVYVSKTKQEIFVTETPGIPAMVQAKRNKILITYPMMNDKGDLEINQSITISTKKAVESNGSEVIFDAVMNTLGIKDKGTCRFSL